MLARSFTLLITTAALFTLSLAQSADAQEKRSLKEVYAEGVKLFNAQQYEAALEQFETFLKHQPTYPYARNYAAQCRQKIRDGVEPKKDLEGALAKINIPSIQFEKTSLDMVFQFLTQKSQELSNGKVVANFIYKGTDQQKANTLVTLNLRDTPFTEVVRYVGQVSKTNFSYEEFAVVATPAGNAPANSFSGQGTESVSLESKFDSGNNLQSVPPANKDPFGSNR
ncbi:MAG: hypothetical protein KDN19_19305 [Verrucomicrobiae bacterium]|nr:hypothetical protein [Verrucomicrobiae bacterium]